MADEPWRMERSIPVALIVGLLTQLIVLVWMVAKYDSRILDADKRITTLEQHEREGISPFQEIRDRLSRIEGQLSMIVERKDPINGTRSNIR